MKKKKNLKKTTCKHQFYSELYSFNSYNPRVEYGNQ